MSEIGVAAGGISASALLATGDGADELAADNEGTARVTVAGALATTLVESADKAVSGLSAVLVVKLYTFLLGDDGVVDALKGAWVVVLGVGLAPAREESIVTGVGGGVCDLDDLGRVAERNVGGQLEDGNIVVDEVAVDSELGVGVDLLDLVAGATADLVAAGADGQAAGCLAADAVAGGQDEALGDDGTTAVKLAVDIILNLVGNLGDGSVLSAPDIGGTGDGGREGSGGEAKKSSSLHDDGCVKEEGVRGWSWRVVWDEKNGRRKRVGTAHLCPSLSLFLCLPLSDTD